MGGPILKKRNVTVTCGNNVGKNSAGTESCGQPAPDYLVVPIKYFFTGVNIQVCALHCQLLQKIGKESGSVFKFTTINTSNIINCEQN
jgi:hypothetical protein